MQTESLTFQRVSETVFAMHGWRVVSRLLFLVAVLLSTTAVFWRMRGLDAGRVVLVADDAHARNAAAAGV